MPSKLTGMLASGKPVLATAFPETQIAKVLNGRGIVVDPENVTAFSNAIEELMNDPSRCESFGQQAREFAVQFLGMESIISRFAEDVSSL